jgi:plastocyanin
MSMTSKFRKPEALLTAPPAGLRRVLRSSLGGLTGLGVAAFLLAANPAHAGEQSVTINLDNFTFEPEQITVTPGTKVTWVNNDDIPHMIVDTKKSFRSKALDTENTFSFTFMDVGDYDYFCSLHPHMTGKVIVRPEVG